MTRSCQSMLILAAAVLSLTPSKLVAGAIIFSGSLTNASNCGPAGCTSVSGLGTSQVTLLESASASNPGIGNVTRSMDFPLFTLGQVTPGVLTLDWSGDFEGSSSGSSGSFAGTVFDLETGTPIPIYTWSGVRGAGSPTIFLPLNLGVPFSITLQATAVALPVPGLSTGANQAAIARISLAPVPEPASILLVLSGLLAIGVAQPVIRHRRRSLN